MINVEPTTVHKSQEAVIDSSESIDVLDVVLILSLRRRLIGSVTLLALVLSVLLALLLRPTFTATAIILPPQQQSSATSLMNQLGSIAALSMVGGSSLNLKTPADMYVGILESRTIADGIVERFQLQRVYGRKTVQDARVNLKNQTKFETGRDGLIHISVSDRDPKRASDIANAYVSSLYEKNSNMVLTEAAQRKAFFDVQLDGERKALATAENDLRATEQRTGIIQLNGQAETIIRMIAQLRAEIASREVQLQSMSTFATDQNPDMSRLQEEIATMRGQVAKLENDEKHEMGPGNVVVPAGRVPEDSLEYARNLREVKYHETLFDLLARQDEAARIDEAHSAPIIQVIDHAVPPEKKSGPYRTLIVIAATLSGFLFSTTYVLFVYGFRRMRNMPTSRQKMDDLCAQWRSPFRVRT
jgi:uncharacterized protein involved in exopolysaccharide biosynthesis